MPTRFQLVPLLAIAALVLAFVVAAMALNSARPAAADSVSDRSSINLVMPTVAATGTTNHVVALGSRPIIAGDYGEVEVWIDNTAATNNTYTASYSVEIAARNESDAYIPMPTPIASGTYTESTGVVLAQGTINAGTFMRIVQDTTAVSGTFAPDVRIILKNVTE